MTEQLNTAAAESAAEAEKTVHQAANQAAEALDAVPEAFRSAAGQMVSHSREAYERTRGAMEETVEMLEKSLDTAGQGAAAINRKLIDITQTNLNAGFDLAKDMAGAKNVAQLVEIQSAYVRKQFETLANQAEEVRDLSTKVATEASEPVKAHMSRSIKSLKTN